MNRAHPLDDRAIEALYHESFARHRNAIERAQPALADGFLALARAAQRCLSGGNKIMFFGNGGSAADAQHLATELTARYARNRRALAAIALTTDSSALTAIGNDFGFDQVFARQVEALGQQNDLAIAISTSGQSENIINALQSCQRLGVRAAGLSGNDGGRMVGLADPLLIVPDKETARIQEIHIMLGQMLCDILEQNAMPAGANPGSHR